MHYPQIYRNDLIDRLFICCPVIIPLAYMYLLGLFPAYEALVFLCFVVLLGETHFGVTWLFFLDRENLRWALKRPAYSVVIPSLLISGFLLVYFVVDSALAILLSSVFSAYHVTMQSVGIAKLYGDRGAASSIATKFIIGSSGLFLLIGFLRFYNPLLDASALTDMLSGFFDPEAAAFGVVFVLLLIAFGIRHAFRDKMSTKFFLAMVTGSLLYSPYLFATRPEHAIAMGVGMHWCQYLAINFPLYFRKLQSAEYPRVSVIGFNVWQLSGLLLAYAFLMGYFRIDHDLMKITSYDFSISYLIVVPLIFQNLHYYSEMFTWKFSNPHIREKIGPYIFVPTAKVASPAEA